EAAGVASAEGPRSRPLKWSETTAQAVQVLDDIHQPLHAREPGRWHAVQMVVVGRNPRARAGVVAADERVEAAVHPEEKESQFAFLARRVDSASAHEARNGRLTGTEDGGNLPLSQVEALGRGQD